MRVRYIGISAVLMLILSAFGLMATVNAAPTATAPAAKVNTPSPIPTKVATTEPTKEPAATQTTAPAVETTATAAADSTSAAGTPVAAAPVTVVTLVLWYEQDPNGGPLKLSAIQINENGVAGPSTAADQKLTGTADLGDANTNTLPLIKIGDTSLDGYAVNPDDPTSVLRWTYFNDDSGLRPSTLVMQVKASAGPYKGYDGSATFISRAPKAGGVLVIALNPPAA